MILELNGAPVLLCDMPTDAPRIAPRCAVWLELAAAGRILELHWQLSPEKLARLPWDALPAPTPAPQGASGSERFQRNRSAR